MRLWGWSGGLIKCKFGNVLEGGGGAGVAVAGCSTIREEALEAVESKKRDASGVHHGPNLRAKTCHPCRNVIW